MDTKTRLLTVLMLCVLVLTLNALAIIGYFESMPAGNKAEAILQTFSLEQTDTDLVYLVL